MIYKHSNNSRLSSRLKEARKLIIVVSLILHLTTAIYSLHAQSTNQKIRITYYNDLLSISVKDADLKKVLLELADQTNINVQFPVSLKKKISINKNGISLCKGLKDILRNLNHIIIYSGIKNNKYLISKVIIYPESKISRKLTGRKIQSYTKKMSSNEKPSSNIEKQSINRQKVKGYERRIELLKKRLAKIDENSEKGKTYSNQIERLEKTIDKLKQNNNRTPEEEIGQD
jgi:hypothetical protein